MFMHSVTIYLSSQQADDTVVVTITAKDKGEPSLSNSTVITVNVDDVNEFAPVFTQEGYVNDIVLDVAVPGT